MGPMQWVSVESWTTIITPSPPHQETTDENQQKPFHSCSANPYPHTGHIPQFKKSWWRVTPWYWDNTNICSYFPCNYSFTIYAFFTPGWSTVVQGMRLSQVNLNGLFTPFLCVLLHFSLLKPLHSSMECITFTTSSDTGRIHNCRKIANSHGCLMVNLQKLKRDQLII